MDDSEAPYDAIAEWYDAYVAGPICQEIILPGVLKLVGDVQGTRILDLACGQGFVARALALQGARVTGGDVPLRDRKNLPGHGRTGLRCTP